MEGLIDSPPTNGEILCNVIVHTHTHTCKCIYTHSHTHTLNGWCDSSKHCCFTSNSNIKIELTCLCLLQTEPRVGAQSKETLIKSWSKVSGIEKCCFGKTLFIHFKLYTAVMWSRHPLQSDCFSEEIWRV